MSNYYYTLKDGELFYKMRSNQNWKRFPRSAVNIDGRFSIVSATDYRQGIVLVGFLGNVYPHDLTQEQIDYIKAFYNMENCAHEICGEWPHGIEPRYPAAKSNFKNGYILLTKEKRT